MVFVYVLQNASNKKIYIGQTANLEKRLKRHNGILPTKNNSFTNKNRNNSSWRVIYKEEYNTREEAIKKEKYLKSHIGRDWLRKTIFSEGR